MWIHEAAALSVRCLLNSAVRTDRLVGCCVCSAVQVPQFVLEQAVLSGQGAGCHVIVTQPRRIAAISVAERVAVERGEKGGCGNMCFCGGWGEGLRARERRELHLPGGEGGREGAGACGYIA